MDLSDFRRDTTVAFIIISVFVFIVWALRMQGWRRRNHADNIDGRTMRAALFYVVQTGSTIYFWMLWGCCLYWLVFFKGQNTVRSGVV